MLHQRVDVHGDLTHLVLSIDTGRRDAVAVRLLDTDEVVALVNREDEERVVLRDPSGSKAVKERRERLVVGLELVDVALGARTKGDVLVTGDAMEVVRV